MKRGIDYIGIGVGAAIFNAKNELLIMKRGKKAKNEKGKWEIPGGSVEFNETIEDALKREVREEIGVEIRIIELLGVCNHIILDEKQHWIAPTFICKITKGKPKILEPDKCEKLEWFSINKAEKLPLSITTKWGLKTIKNKFPKGYKSSIFFSLRASKLKK